MRIGNVWSEYSLLLILFLIGAILATGTLSLLYIAMDGLLVASLIYLLLLAIIFIVFDLIFFKFIMKREGLRDIKYERENFTLSWRNIHFISSRRLIRIMIYNATLYPFITAAFLIYRPFQPLPLFFFSILVLVGLYLLIKELRSYRNIVSQQKKMYLWVMDHDKRAYHKIRDWMADLDELSFTGMEMVPYVGEMETFLFKDSGLRIHLLDDKRSETLLFAVGPVDDENRNRDLEELSNMLLVIMNISHNTNDTKFDS